MSRIELEAMEAIIRIAYSLEQINVGLAALVKQNEQRLAREEMREKQEASDYE